MENIAKISPSKMLKKINDFYLNELKKLQNQLWEHRRICILQVNYFYFLTFSQLLVV